MWVEGGGWWWPDGLERERRPLADTGLVLISPWQSGPRLQSVHTRDVEDLSINSAFRQTESVTIVGFRPFLKT